MAAATVGEEGLEGIGHLETRNRGRGGRDGAAGRSGEGRDSSDGPGGRTRGRTGIGPARDPPTPWRGLRKVSGAARKSLKERGVNESGRTSRSLRARAGADRNRLRAWRAPGPLAPGGLGTWRAGRATVRDGLGSPRAPCQATPTARILCLKAREVFKCLRRGRGGADCM